VISATRDDLLQSMTGRLPPERVADYLEIPYQQLLELIRPSLKHQNKPTE